jgi:serine/threonine protein phosphatase 1
MKLTYAIADLHGRYDLFTEALKAIETHRGSNEYKIITLGDYIDRGPQSFQIIEHLMELQEMEQPVICLKGNHEAMMIETIVDSLSFDWWGGNGGHATLISYGHPRHKDYPWLLEGYTPLKYVSQEHLRWLSSLPLMHVDEHRIYVHAGVDNNRDLDKQLEERVLWKLYPHGDKGEPQFGKHVVHGHHQFEDGPKLYEGRTDLDTGAFYTHRLVVGVFDDDKPGGPIDTIEVKIAPLP